MNERKNHEHYYGFVGDGCNDEQIRDWILTYFRYGYCNYPQHWYQNPALIGYFNISVKASIIICFIARWEEMEWKT